MGEKQKPIHLLILLVCFSLRVSSQENFHNYFDFIHKEQITLNDEIKNNNEYTSDLTFTKNQKKIARWQWFWQYRIDEKGDLNSYHKELFATDNIDKLREHPISTVVENPTWKIIGPETYPTGSNPSGIKGIGRIDAIVTNPTNKNHVIIGARAGGIWETHNINETIPHWKCLTNNLPIATVNDLKIVNNTLFASTSNKTQLIMQGDSSYGLGIIKKGLNDSVWQLSNQTFESKKIAVSKKNKKLLYAIGEKYIYKSTDKGDNWLKLTNPISNIESSKIFLTNIEINPNDDKIIMITGRLNIYNSTHNKEHDILIFKSENGGKSWINLTSDLENFVNNEIEKANAKDKPISLTKGLKNHISTYIYNEQLFLCIQQMYRPNHVYFVTLDGLWKHFNLYNSLSKSNTYYYGTDNVDARFQVINKDEILIGNRKLRLISNKNHSIKTLDHNYKYLHQDIRTINYDASIKRLLVGTDGGINMNISKKNENRFTKFTNLSGNLNLFLAYNMSYIHHNNTQTVRIGTQDTGYYKSDFLDNHWTGWTRFGPFGEGMIYTDPYDTDIVYRINAGGHGGNIQKSINSGHTFTNTKVKAGNYVFTPLEISKNNTHHLVFDNYKRFDQYTLSLSNDQMKTAVSIDNGINELDMGMNLALALSKKDTSLFYVARKKPHFKNNGIYNSLFKSSNFDFYNPDKIIYTNLNDNIKKLDSTILNQAFITHIELNKSNTKELWISFGNLEKGKKIFHSIDGGLNWKNISTNLPNIPVNIIKHDTRNDQLYIGNDYGVYALNKNSKQWYRYGKGLPVAIVTSIEIDSKKNELIAGTYGRSVWTTSILKQEDIIIDSDTTWNTSQKINGDLIIKEGNTLNINNITLNTNNIIIENNATLNVHHSILSSNQNKMYGNYLNTNILLTANSNFKVKDTRIENYTINAKPNSKITFFGTEKITLQQTEIAFLNNATYHHHKKTPLLLLDKDSKLLFPEGVKLGEKPNFTKIEKIKFKGNGSIKF